MPKISKYFIWLAILGLSACATRPPAENEGESSGESQELANSETENNPDEMICRREIVSGTNFRREVCRTRADREESSRQTQEFLDRQRDRAQ